MLDTISNLKNQVIHNPSYTNLKIYLAIAIPIIILLIYFIYKYTFSNRSLNAIAAMKYKDNITPKSLPQCYELDPSMQYKLCDYYISASAMTPCVGNQHYDYVSTEMITEILHSGARFIQIPICESDISANAMPVVGTAQYGQRIITSLNTLDIRNVLQVIRQNAFTIGKGNKKYNYPLFIHLILNTNNTYTINTLANIIQELLADIILPPAKYHETPIFLEKLCNLLGKIIIFATPEYKSTKLEKYVIPTFKMFKIYRYNEISNIQTPPDGFKFDTLYNNRLSGQQQTRSNQRFQTKYPNLDYIITNRDTIGDTILNDPDILDNLNCFNKVGMTLVLPHQPTDVVSANYNITDAVYNGCQFIAMNFQINNDNDNNMKTYLEIFKNGSFLLKPASMRFTESEAPTRDITALYKAIEPKDDNILNNILARYEMRPIILESYSNPNMYLTTSENGLTLTPGSASRIDRVGKRTFIPGIEQAFILNKSIITQGRENTPIIIQSGKYLDKYITYSGETGNFALDNKGANNKDLTKQSFYFERAEGVEASEGQSLAMVRLIDASDSTSKLYLGIQNKKVKAMNDSSQIITRNNMTFNIITPAYHVEVQFTTIFNGGVKTMGGGIVGIMENNPTVATSYIMEPVNKSISQRFNYLKDEFYLRNGGDSKNTYLNYDSTSNYLYDRESSTSNNNTIQILNANFRLGSKINGIGKFAIINNRGDNLAIFQNNILKFTPPEKVISNENLFNIRIKYILE